jgi:hypothetical protein
MIDADAVVRSLQAKSKVTTYVGRYVGNDGMSALVDFNDQRITIPFETAYVPQINEPVVIRSTDGVLSLVGPSTPKPGMGVVATVAGSEVTVDTDFGSFKMPYTGEAPTSGDTVGITWSTAPWCAKLSTSQTVVAPPPDPGSGGSTVHSAEFRAVQAGSTDRGAPRFWTDRPYASNSTYGLWFYGPQIKDTIPASATFVSLEMYIAYNQRQGDPPNFVLHSDQYAAGIPAMTGIWTWDAPSGWQTPLGDPAVAGTWFAALKSGGDRAGVGLNQGGYNIFKSLAQDGQSGALRITWRS